MAKTLEPTIEKKMGMCDAVENKIIIVTRGGSQNDVFGVGKYFFCLTLVSLGNNHLAFGNRVCIEDKQLDQRYRSDR